jgi:CelD/BcsL family acetyltransferase involved in cellulose biosynthesis
MSDTWLRRDIGVDAALAAFDERWEWLAEADPGTTVFQTGHWCRAWIKAVATADRQEPVILRWFQGDRLVLGVALQIGPDRCGGRTVSPLGSPWIDYQETVGSAPDELLPAAAREIRQLASQFKASLRFSDVRADGTLERILSQLSAVYEPSTPVISIDLRNTEHLARLLHSQEYRMKRRRLMRLGPLVLRHHRDPSAIKQAFPRFVTLHRAQWRGRADAVAPFDDLVVQDGFWEIALSTATGRIMLLTELVLGSTLLASYFGFVYRKRYYAYRTAFDQAWFRYSPGHVMLKGMLENFVSEGIEHFDLMRGGYAYKAGYGSDFGRNQKFEVSYALDGGRAAISEGSPGRMWAGHVGAVGVPEFET